MNPAEKANALIEALPYLQAFRSKTILIKMGGSAMEDPELVANVMRDITFLEVAGINPVVVHGGGKAISAAMEKSGIAAKFINGLRYTSDDAIDIVSRVLSNEINPGLVRMIRDFGGKATGVPGTRSSPATMICWTISGLPTRPPTSCSTTPTAGTAVNRPTTPMK